MNPDLTGFVTAAYLVTLVGIGAYVWSLAFRIRSATRRMASVTSDGPSDGPSDGGSELHVVELAHSVEAHHVR